MKNLFLILLMLAVPCFADFGEELGNGLLALLFLGMFSGVIPIVVIILIIGIIRKLFGVSDAFGLDEPEVQKMEIPDDPTEARKKYLDEIKKVAL